MADSMYANMIIPAAASYPTGDASCCGGDGPTGAAPASSPEERRTDAAGGLGGVLRDGTPGAGGGKHRGRGACRCWWVALAAVVLIAVVAKS